MTLKELEQLYKKVEEVRQKPIAPIFFKDQERTDPLPENTVIDPDQSINWNKQQVALYNEALEKNKQAYRNEVKQAQNKYQNAYNDFLINDPEYGNGEITFENLQRMLSFMYDYAEDDYHYENGFYSHMCYLQSLIEIWRHVY